MFRYFCRLSALVMALMLVAHTPASAQDIDFGDDGSDFAKDGECDDKRFSGPGMTDTPLLDSDIGHDATDCRIAHEQGRVTYRGTGGRDSSHIQWGDDLGRWANDGECDDMRFEGSGMTKTGLLAEDVKHDATDCRSAYEAGNLDLRGSGSATGNASDPLSPIRRIVPIRIEGPFDWGNNSSQWANDGECDDIRFTGSGMSTVLMPDSIGMDAADCRNHYDAGSVGLNPLFKAPASIDDIDFGNNTSDYANDGECDDLRFTGDYASEMIYLTEDIGHDANDCRAAVRKGTARWQMDSLPIELGATAAATEEDAAEAAADAVAEAFDET